MVANAQNCRKFVLVGAKADGGVIKQHGGVLTLSNGLVDYASRTGLEIEVINTLRSGFDHQPLVERIRSGIGRALVLFKLLLNDKYDGVIVFSGAGWSFYERVFLAFICKLLRAPCAFFIVDGWFLNVRGKTILIRIWIGLLLKIPCKLAASGSNWVSLFSELGVRESKIITIRYWLPNQFRVVETPKILSASEPARFVFVGWMIKEKGIDEILAALEILLKKYQFSFTFIGGGTLLDYVRETVSFSVWEANVSVLGWQSPEQIEQALSSAHVFVLPSYAEGFPMSLIEAMSKGLPAICTDVGGISDSLHDGINGFLIPPKNVDALTKAMEFYICNHDIVSEHSSATLEIVRENHDADLNCSSLFNIFPGG